MNLLGMFGGEKRPRVTNSIVMTKEKGGVVKETIETPGGMTVTRVEGKIEEPPKPAESHNVLPFKKVE